MNRNFFQIEQDHNGQRLDKYLADTKDDLSRSYVQKLIEETQVTVNGQGVKPSYKLKSGDSIELVIPEPSTPDIQPVPMDLDIIYEDKDIIVINKAAGLVVHPVPGNFNYTLVNALLAYTDDLSGINGVKRPGIVHRLDKNTSGVLVVAKNDLSHRELVKQFKKRQTRKIYHAIVKGKLPYEKGKIEAPIGRNPIQRKKMAVVAENSKQAVTNFSVIERLEEFTYVEVIIETGRTHQIRVHFSYLGYPILGDEKYGKQRNKYGVKRQMLHAYQLGIHHPKNSKWMEFTAPLTEDFQETLAKLRKT